MGIGNNRITGGRKAKLAGSSFESLFQKCCDYYQVACTRIPDSCRQVSASKLIRIKSPFDFILTYRGRSAFIDTKSTLKGNFSHSLIDEHQVSHLCLHEAYGASSGYVIYLRQKELVIFVPAYDLSKLRYVTGSIDETYPKAKHLGNARLDPRIIFS